MAVRFWIILLLLSCRLLLAGTFTVATYNLEFYVDRPTLSYEPKSETARTIIRQSIRAPNGYGMTSPAQNGAGDHSAEHSRAES